MSSVVSVRPAWRPAAWHLALAVAPVVIAAYYAVGGLGRGLGGLQVALYVSANASVVVGGALAARRHRHLRAPLLLLAGSAAAGALADTVFYMMALVGGEVAYPSVADIGYLAAYPLMAAGLLLIVRLRTPGWDGASAIDAAIVAVSAAFVVFVFVVAPTVALSSGWDIAKLVSVAYPVGDLMLIAVGARLLLGAGPRTLPLRLIGAYLGLVLYADTMYGVQTLNGTYQVANYLDALWMLSGFVLCAALLHPALPRMAQRSSTVAPDSTPGRLAVLAVAAMVAPTTLFVQHLRGQPTHPTLTAFACNAVFLLVIARMAGLVRAQRQAAITDGLTGLRTRRFFEQTLRGEGERARRAGTPLGVLLLDIDHFKAVNDTHGHHGGDLVLVEVAHRMRALARPGDLVARYGGEEFAILLPGAGQAETLRVAERVRRGIAAAPIACAKSTLQEVTASIGAASMPETCHDTDELLLAVDRALYAAKNAGRDRVGSAAG